MSDHSDDLPPPGSVCPNCNAPMSGTWCATCGQKWGPLDPTWHDLIHEAGHEFLHVDGKIFRTLRLLLTRPGELTAEFLRGRRIRYIGPLRLYLTMSVLFFLLAAVIPNVNPSDAAAPSGAATAGDSGQGVAMEGAGRITSEMTHAFPKVVFALVPVFALFLKMLYRRSGRHYAAFLYFSLHLHSALFVFMALTLPLQAFASDIWLTASEVLVLLGVLAYLVFGLKRAFGDTTTTALRRAALAAALQLSVFALALAALVSVLLHESGASRAGH